MLLVVDTRYCYLGYSLSLAFKLFESGIDLYRLPQLPQLSCLHCFTPSQSIAHHGNNRWNRSPLQGNRIRYRRRNRCLLCSPHVPLLFIQAKAPLTFQARNNLPSKPLHVLQHAPSRRIQHRLPLCQTRPHRRRHRLIMDMVSNPLNLLDLRLQLRHLRSHVVRRHGNLANPPLRPNCHKDQS